MLMMPTTRQMHETTAVFNTHGVVVQRMIDKVRIMTPILIIMMMVMKTQNIKQAREDLLWAQYMKCDGRWFLNNTSHRQ